MNMLKWMGAVALVAVLPLASMSDASARPGGGGQGASRGGGSPGGGGGMRAGGMGGGMRAGGGAAMGARSGGGAAFANRGNFAGNANRGAFVNNNAQFGGNRGNWSGQRFAGRRYGRGIGPGIGFAAGLAAGSALSSNYYNYNSYPYYGAGYNDYYDDSYAYDDNVAVAGVGEDDVESCAARFRSYDRRTQTYLSYDGNRYSCP